MRNAVLILSLLIATVPAFADLPLCDADQAKSVAVQLIRMNVVQADRNNIEFRNVILTDVSYDALHNQLFQYTVKWGFKSGELKYETYSMDMELSSVLLETEGRCVPRTMRFSNVTE